LRAWSEQAWEAAEEPLPAPVGPVHVARTFAEWEQQAVAEMDEVDTSSGKDARALHAQQVRTLAKAASSRELTELVETGLLPEQVLRSTGTAQTDHPR
jgi:hypothetical protein